MASQNTTITTVRSSAPSPEPIEMASQNTAITTDRSSAPSPEPIASSSGTTAQKPKTNARKPKTAVQRRKTTAQKSKIVGKPSTSKVTKPASANKKIEKVAAPEKEMEADKRSQEREGKKWLKDNFGITQGKSTKKAAPKPPRKIGGVGLLQSFLEDPRT